MWMMLSNEDNKIGNIVKLPKTNSSKEIDIKWKKIGKSTSRRKKRAYSDITLNTRK